MSGLLRSSAVFSAMTLLSRIAGFVRDMLQGMLFGTGGAMSAFIVAYRIPNFLRRVFAEGSMAMAFVPVLNEIKQRGDRAALKDFIDHMAGALCAVVLVVAAVGVLLAPLVAGLFTPGWAVDQPEKFAQASAMLRVTFPYLLFISMMALAASILNSFGKFALPAFTPVLHNLTMIAAMFWLAPRFDVPPMGLAWGVLIAGFLQLALLWPALGRLGLRPRLRMGFRHPEVRKVGRLMLPTLFSSSVAQVNLLVGTAFASLLVDGSQDWLYYSDRLIEFPLGLFGVALGTVILPHLSRRHADADAGGYSASLDWGMRTALLVGVPAALGLMLLTVAITWPLWRNGVAGAHGGIAAASGLAGLFNAGLLWLYLRRAGLHQPQPGWGRYLLRMLVASVAMSLAVLAMRAWVGDWAAIGDWRLRVGWLLLAVAAGAVTYGLAQIALGLRLRHLRH